MLFRGELIRTQSGSEMCVHAKTGIYKEILGGETGQIFMKALTLISNILEKWELATPHGYGVNYS